MSFLIAGTAIVFLVFCGFGLVKIILRDNIPFSLFGLIPLSFGAGLGLLAFMVNSLMALGLRMSFWTIFAPLFLLFAYALTQLKVNYKFMPERISEAAKGFSLREWLFIFVIVFGVLSVFVLSITFPLHFWDSRAIWGTKAKMLYYGGTVLSPNFMDTSRINPGIRYPLLFPISQACIYFAIGHVDDWAVMMLIGLFFAMLVSFLYDSARLYLQDREKGLAAAAMISVLPVFFMSDGPAYSGYCDTPLATLFCFAFGTTLLWKKLRGLPLLVLSAFLTGILFLTKNEGSNLVAIIIFLIAMPDGIRISKEAVLDYIRSMLIFLAIIALVILPWVLVMGRLPSGGSVADVSAINLKNLLNNLSKIPVVLGFTAKALMGIQANMMKQYFLWGILWAIFAVTSLTSLFLRLWNCIYLTLAVFLYMIFISAIYIILPWEISAGAMIGNFFRLYLAVNPLVIMQIVSTLKGSERVGSRGD